MSIAGGDQVSIERGQADAHQGDQIAPVKDKISKFTENKRSVRRDQIVVTIKHNSGQEWIDENDEVCPGGEK
jgi:hypothetical protein